MRWQREPEAQVHAGNGAAGKRTGVAAVGIHPTLPPPENKEERTSMSLILIKTHCALIRVSQETRAALLWQRRSERSKAKGKVIKWYQKLKEV